MISVNCSHISHPGRPISRVLSRAVIYLGRRLPAASSGLPGAQTGRAAPWGVRVQLNCTLTPLAPAWPCSRWGLPGRPGHPRRRWSLTPPFHHHRSDRVAPAVCFCGPFRRVTPPGCYPAPCPVEPGLSSPRAWPRGVNRGARPPGRPGCWFHHNTPPVLVKEWPGRSNGCGRRLRPGDRLRCRERRYSCHLAGRSHRG